MIYDQRLTAFDGSATQYRLHLDMSRRTMTGAARLYQVPLPQNNPGGHLAYLVERWETDLWSRVHEDTDSALVELLEACAQRRLPGLT